MKKQYGYTLIELLVSALIGIFITAGLAQIYLSTQHNFNIQNSLTRLQENGRYAHYFLSKDIRAAGYLGCTHVNNIATTNLLKNVASNTTITSDTLLNGFKGNKQSWSPGLPSWLTSHLARGTRLQLDSDIIVLKKVAAKTAQLQQPMTNPIDPVQIMGNSITVKPNTLFFITDCDSADLFMSSNGSVNTTITHSTSDNHSASLSKAYTTEAHIGLYESLAFYVKETGRKNSVGDPIYALYRQLLSGKEQELVEGIETLKIRYGIDTNGDGSANSFLTADTVTNNNAWDKVISVRIAMLVNSIEPSHQSQQAYTFNGRTVTTPGDRLARKQWDVVVQLRNY